MARWLCTFVGGQAGIFTGSMLTGVNQQVLAGTQSGQMVRAYASLALPPGCCTDESGVYAANVLHPCPCVVTGRPMVLARSFTFMGLVCMLALGSTAAFVVYYAIAG